MIEAMSDPMWKRKGQNVNSKRTPWTTTTTDDEDVPKTHAKKPKRDHEQELSMTSLVH